MVKAQQRQAAKVGSSFLVAQHWCHRMNSTLLDFTRPYLTFLDLLHCYTLLHMIPLLDACQHPPWTAQLSPRQGRQGTCSSRASASATLKEPWNSLLEAMNGTNAPHALNALITHSLHRLPSSPPGWTFKASRAEPTRKPPVGSKFAMWTLRSDEIFDSNRSGENVSRKQHEARPARHEMWISSS